MRILRKLNTKNLMKSKMETDIETTSQFEEYYMNQMQILVNVIDANNIFAEVARAGGRRKVSPAHVSSVRPMTCQASVLFWYIRPTLP